MQSRLNPPRALVFGGTGTLGAEVLKGLARANIPTAFTWHQSRERAHALASELSMRPMQVDLSDAVATRGALRALREEGFAPNLFIHCAGLNASASLDKITDELWQKTMAVNCQSAFIACQELAPTMAQAGEGHIVLVGALDRTQSAPSPVHFAASQGALSAMAMAVSKELGPKGVRINVVALGLLEGGLSREVGEKLVADYKGFSALRRLGRPEEAAKAILWLALENTYMNGKVMPVNGGI
ncbi:MAG: SDR family NAD(P)-dependent oxidoreductase [Hyalangium sp.]|uniref:SDR family NAD(P)-dependent oxidoreductase n=1 Tax=Hyalangium sp. TaxID=2028555 RepID=UPI00389A1FA7